MACFVESKKTLVYCHYKAEKPLSLFSYKARKNQEQTKFEPSKHRKHKPRIVNTMKVTPRF